MDAIDIAREAGQEIAVIGLAARFPGAPTAERFWENLCRGVESITVFDEAAVIAAGIDPAMVRRADYVRAKPVLDDIDKFDAGLFDISPRDAALMDPQHRLFLECAWEALEDAGYDPSAHRAPIGIFAAAGKNTYLPFNLLPRTDWLHSDEVFQLLSGNEKDYLATRVAYHLHLRGPSLSVQTACSSALVAVHLACQSLLLGECDIALAGAANVDVPREAGYLYRAGGILSADGHCRPFSARAGGTLFGHGVGVVVLRRASDALRQGDAVRARILASAVNNDGGRSVGFAAPSVDGQREVIAEALAMAQIAPGTIGLVEGHGTATAIGDAVEIRALQAAFEAAGWQQGRRCALGSVKSNVGHLGAAAGVAGLIKMVLAVQHGVIPPTLHANEPSPLLATGDVPFVVAAEGREWRSEQAPRRGAVSAFGQGGTNAHLILEQPPARPRQGETGTWQVLPLSAATDAALDELRARLSSALSRRPFPLEDVAHTLQVGRRALRRRSAVAARYVDGRGLQIEPVDSAELDQRTSDLARAWLAGRTVDWRQLWAASSAGRVPLPTYPFQRSRHWVDPVAPASRAPDPRRDDRDEGIDDVVARVFRSVLGVETMAPEDDFFDLGGHSLLEVQVRSRLAAALDIQLPQGILWERPTIDALTTYIRREHRDVDSTRTREAEADRDVALDDDIRADGPFSVTTEARHVLLTGVTGFFGSHLLERLLQDTDATIHCLLRASSPEEGRARISAALREYSLDCELDNRVVVVAGDLTEQCFGLSAGAFDRLARTIDVVYHAGAHVNFVQPYSVLKRTNVTGTQEVLRLSARSHVKPVHHVSSVAVFESDSMAGRLHVTEADDVEESRGFHNGYDASKWVAERIVGLARRRHLPVSIYRVSNIVGDSRTGIVLPHHIFACLVKGCIQLGAAPADDDFVNVVPVDAAARAIVELSRAPIASPGRSTYHVVSPVQTPIRALIAWLASRGYAMDPVPYDVWRQRLRQTSDDNAFKPFLGLIDQGRMFTNRTYDATNARRQFQAAGTLVVDEPLLDMYLRHWVRSGFLE